MYRLGLPSATSEEDGSLCAVACTVQPGVQIPVDATLDGRELFSLNLSTSGDSPPPSTTWDVSPSGGISRRLSTASSDSSLDGAVTSVVQSSATGKAPLGRQRSGWAWKGWGGEGGIVAGEDGWTNPIAVTAQTSGPARTSSVGRRGTLSIPGPGPGKLPIRLMHRKAALECVLVSDSSGARESRVRAFRPLPELPENPISACRSWKLNACVCDLEVSSHRCWISATFGTPWVHQGELWSNMTIFAISAIFGIFVVLDTSFKQGCFPAWQQLAKVF